MSDTELQRRLSHVLGQEVARLDRRRSRYSTSFPIDELDAELEDGSTLTLVGKDLSWGALLPEATGAKPEFLHDPLREIEVYRSALVGAGLGTAAFHGAWVRPECDQYCLFVERVTGVELWQVGDLEVWAAVAAWLARFHHTGPAPDPPLRDRLLLYNRDYYQAWARRARAFHRDADASRRGRLDWVLARHDGLVDRLLALDSVFIHGELYPSNVLVQVAGGPRICPIDWELAALGPALVDLAALVSGGWTPEERFALVRSYESALVSLTGRAVDHRALVAALDLCRLHLCVRWLGWARRWSPPPEHAQDWLGESVELAEAIAW